MTTEETGGYEEGYRGVPCLWGTKPGSLIEALMALTSVAGKMVVDLGAGEGKNAYFLAAQGAAVTAVEMSTAAIDNGLRTFGSSPKLTWIQSDVRGFEMEPESVEVVICYGLLHCLPSERAISEEVFRYQASTSPGGWHVICSFNDRSQDLSAHPGFRPTLLPHGTYVELYRDWHIAIESDSDLVETHPHNKIEHTHSLTRIIAQRPA